MNLVDIQDTITKLLHDNFPTYKIVLNQQCDVVKPTFFVSIRKINTDNALFYKDKTVNVTITYVNKEYNHVENNDINDKLDDLFTCTLQVSNDYLTINNLDFSEPDALICSFTLNFRETIPKDNDKNTNKMENLVQNL